MATNIDEIFEIVQELTTDNVGVLIAVLKPDGETFQYGDYGDMTFLQKIAILEALKHQLLQEPHEQNHISEYHKE